MKLLLALLLVLVLGACSTSPPKPDNALGEPRASNVDAQALAELLEIARNGMPRRYKAERGADLHQTLVQWSRIAGLTLNWESAQVMRTVGAIDEFDIRTAVMALAQQYHSNTGNLIVQFPDPRSVQVSDLKTPDADGCPKVPAGAIVFGLYCMTAPTMYFVEPSDTMLSAVFNRWAQTAGLELRWKAALDWPVQVQTRKPYQGDLLQALTMLTKELSGQEAALKFSITSKELFIERGQPKEKSK